MNRILTLGAILACFVIPLNCFSQALPIKPARTIAFTTHVGSNMDVDVSPDGKILVFDLLGDLYTLPVTGGTATQLTHGMAINVNPSWSPDGKMIAYLSDWSGSMHLNVRSLEGHFHTVLGKTEKQLDISDNYYFKSHQPVWTIDGHYIALKDSLYGVVSGKIAMPAGTQQLQRFSPDEKFAYGIDSNKLVRWSLQNLSKCNISGQLAEFQSASLSPNAHWWAYTADSIGKRWLIISDLSSNSAKALTFSHAKPTDNDREFFPHFAFSQDSRYIYIGYGGHIHRITASTGEDKVIPFTIHVKADLGVFNYHTFRVTSNPFRVQYIRSANIDPDGRRLIFEALNRIYVMGLPNGKPRILCPQTCNQYQPVYSPDGKWIAYVTWCDTSGGYLWKVSSDGYSPERITKIAGQYQHPAWSPDGKYVAVIKGGPSFVETGVNPYAEGKGEPKLLGDDWGIGQLQLINLNSGHITAVVDSVPLWNQVNFSANGTRITYMPYYTDKPFLVSKDTASKNRQILNAGNFSTDPNKIKQRCLSPDGRFLIYSIAEDLYLIPVNHAGKIPALSRSRAHSQCIRFAPGVDPYWARGGKEICWTYGHTFFSVSPEKIIKTVGKSVAGNKSSVQQKDGFVTAWVKPDRTINIDLTAKPAYAHGTIALTDVRIITMKGNHVIQNGTVIIKNGRFDAIGSSATVHIPTAAKCYNLKGKTIMPGLINVHLHQSAPSDVGPQEYPVYLSNFAFGVTTMRDPFSSIDSYGYTELLKTGQMIGPRLFSSGPGVMAEDGIAINNYDDALAIAFKRKTLGGTFIKQYLINNKTRQQKEWLLMAAREYGLNMTNEGEIYMPLALAQLKDGSSGIEHNPYWGYAYDDLFTFWAKSHTYFTPTLNVRPGNVIDVYRYWHTDDPKLARFRPEIMNMLSTLKPPVDSSIFNNRIYTVADAEIRKKGGRVALGTDGNNPIDVHNELWTLQMGGLSNLQALQAATIVGARAIGIQKDVGSIEPGKIADLIVLNSNPLDDIHNSRDIKYVMKDGILYDGDTLDELWPVYKKCPEWHLHAEQKK